MKMLQLVPVKAPVRVKHSLGLGLDVVKSYDNKLDLVCLTHEQLMMGVILSKGSTDLDIPMPVIFSLEITTVCQEPEDNIKVHHSQWDVINCFITPPMVGRGSPVPQTPLDDSTVLGMIHDVIKAHCLTSNGAETLQIPKGELIELHFNFIQFTRIGYIERQATFSFENRGLDEFIHPVFTAMQQPTAPDPFNYTQPQQWQYGEIVKLMSAGVEKALKYYESLYPPKVDTVESSATADTGAEVKVNKITPIVQEQELTVDPTQRLSYRDLLANHINWIKDNPGQCATSTNPLLDFILGQQDVNEMQGYRLYVRKPVTGENACIFVDIFARDGAYIVHGEVSCSTEIHSASFSRFKVYKLPTNWRTLFTWREQLSQGGVWPLMECLLPHLHKDEKALSTWNGHKSVTSCTWNKASALFGAMYDAIKDLKAKHVTYHHPTLSPEDAFKETELTYRCKEVNMTGLTV